MALRAEDVLPDGVERAEFGGVPVRKGTVAAFIGSARAWSDPSSSAAERAEAERDILASLPALRATGLFDVLSVKDPALAALVGEG